MKSSNIFNRIGFLLLMVLTFGTFSVIPTVQGHGLDMTTASVMVRNKNHLIIRIQYDPLKVLYQTEMGKKSPMPLPLLANVAKPVLATQYEAIKAAIQNQLVVHYGGKAVESIQFRFPSIGEFQKLIREQFMNGVIDQSNQSAEKPEAFHHDRQYYQTVELDGFLARGISEGALDIRFPLELGQILVSYSQPIVQTLSPTSEGSHYQQKIKIGP